MRLDSLILIPYSLEDGSDIVWDIARGLDGKQNKDAAMEPDYKFIREHQTLRARLDTLINIVKGVGEAGIAQSGKLAFTSLSDPDKNGMVGPKWSAAADRDNRGKVYLYFCPEDMTVALGGVKGIGWQGVPDFMRGRRVKPRKTGWDLEGELETVERRPLKELGGRFYQRVFTKKCRPDPVKGKPVMVGLPCHDFALHLDGEDDHAHVSTSGRSSRAHLPTAAWPPQQNAKPEDSAARQGMRTINAEPLRKPVSADLGTSTEIYANSPQAKGVNIREKDADGPLEQVDPIDADIAVASDGGLGLEWLYIDDENAGRWNGALDSETSPAPKGFEGLMQKACGQIMPIQERLNQGKQANEERYKVVAVHRLFKEGLIASGYMVQHVELYDQARKRWRKLLAPKSFHGAIIGSVANHRNVTAFDVGIGRGKSVSHSLFNECLCAIADWRLKMEDSNEERRPGVQNWDNFQIKFAYFWSKEAEWCANIVSQNASYYSSGVLPNNLPSILDRPLHIVCESVDGTIARKK
jgi:hypothetical protein